MKWTLIHDLELLKEILAERPFDYPKRSREIGAVWTNIVSNLKFLNAKEGIQFSINTIRAVRDRYQLLETKFKRNARKELNASGIQVEPTEFETAMEDIVAYFENQEANADKEKEAKLKTIENEKGKAEEIRLNALETFSGTRKRKCEGSQDTLSNAKKRLGAVQYLKDKSEKEMALKKEEMELRRRELEVKEAELKLHSQQQGEMMKALFSLLKKDNS